ncbi:MAG: hypothetical protein VYA08_07905, partial [Pseudomonadota bacterium]|nr:hypothetical protein [Pseudomonadota bacterium]
KSVFLCFLFGKYKKTHIFRAFKYRALWGSFAVPGLAVSAKLAWFIDIARKTIMNLDHPRGFENA